MPFVIVIRRTRWLMALSPFVCRLEIIGRTYKAHMRNGRCCWCIAQYDLWNRLLCFARTDIELSMKRKYRNDIGSASNDLYRRDLLYAIDLVGRVKQRFLYEFCVIILCFFAGLSFKIVLTLHVCIFYSKPLLLSKRYCAINQTGSSVLYHDVHYVRVKIWNWTYSFNL